MEAFSGRLKSCHAPLGQLRMLMLLLMLQLHVWPATGSHHPALWENPYAHPAFDNNTNRDQTITVGQTANLACTVRNLGDRAVSWIRKHDLHIITIGIMTYTNDQRFQAIHAEGSDEWTLRITSGQPRDSAVYECQVSTEPKISLAFRLTVVVAKARIQANSEMFYKSGSDINLTCTSEMVSHAPSFIYWYKDGYLINYSQRGGINVLTEQQTARSTLLISRAAPPDSGNYTCFPSNTNSASVLVHVIKTEHRAAMQHENNAATRPRMADRHALCLAMALLVVVLMPLLMMPPPPPPPSPPTLRPPPSTSSSSLSETTVDWMVASLFSPSATSTATTTATAATTTTSITSTRTGTGVSSLAKPVAAAATTPATLLPSMQMNHHPAEELSSVGRRPVHRQTTTTTTTTLTSVVGAGVGGVTALMLMIAGSGGQWPRLLVSLALLVALLLLLLVLLVSAGPARPNIVQLAENEDDDRKSTALEGDDDGDDDGDDGRVDPMAGVPRAEQLQMQLRRGCGYCSPHNWTGRTAIASLKAEAATATAETAAAVVSCHSWWLPEMVPAGSSTLASSLWATRSPRTTTTTTTTTWTWKNSRRWPEPVLGLCPRRRCRRSLTTFVDHRSIVILGGGSCCLRLWTCR